MTTYFCMVRPRPCSSLVDPEQSVFPPLVKYKTRAGKYTQHSTAKAKEKLLASLKSREVRETGRVRGIRGIGRDSDGDSGLWIGMGMELRIGRGKNLPEALACYMLAIEQTIPKCNLQ